MNFYKRTLIAMLFVLVFSACTAGNQNDLSAKELLVADIDFLVTEMQAMYNDVRPELLYDPFLYIALADIDFDEIPEFFFGYETMTGSHDKIWYRAYSLKVHSIIDSEHPLPPYWFTYLDDEACAFFTSPENFIEGYYLNGKAEPCFVTMAYAGPVVDIRTDFVFIRYEDSKLFIETGFECNESLTPLKQAWSLTALDSVHDDIIELLNEYLDFPSQLQSQAEEGITPEKLTIGDILHNFNWMSDDGNYQNEFVDKPFLQINADGSSGAAGVCDINRDGEMEFLMAVYHVPRGIPSVEIFAIENNQLLSLGGFFEARDMPRKLSYYRDKQGRLLFLQETESYYGGIDRTLVATYVDGFHNVPIAYVYSYYYDDEQFPNQYYIFPEDMETECTNYFLCGGFLDVESGYEATQEEYNTRIAEFMDSLTWVEDVEYDYCVYYHLYNSHELTNEIRDKEISEGLNASPPKDFHTPEEMKKTSDMVADALYKAYIS